VRIEAIEPLSSLAPDEAMVLDEMLDDHPELDRESLVVYRITRGGTMTQPLVAPANDVLQLGMAVVSLCWWEATQLARAGEPRERTIELHLAPALEPDDLAPSLRPNGSL